MKNILYTIILIFISPAAFCEINLVCKSHSFFNWKTLETSKTSDPPMSLTIFPELKTIKTGNYTYQYSEQGNEISWAIEMTISSLPIMHSYVLDRVTGVFKKNVLYKKIEWKLGVKEESWELGTTYTQECKKAETLF